MRLAILQLMKMKLICLHISPPSSWLRPYSCPWIFKRILEFDPADHGFNITAINTKLNHLLVLAITGQLTIGKPERIQHTLTA